MSSLRRSARIAAKNAPSTPVKSRSKRETPSAPMKENTHVSRSIVTPITTKPGSIHEFYHSPALVAARAAAEALYPAYSKEYYNELEKSEALQEWRAAYWNSLPFSISAGW